jgi:hypothetical protein
VGTGWREENASKQKARAHAVIVPIEIFSSQQGVGALWMSAMSP